MHIPFWQCNNSTKGKYQTHLLLLSNIECWTNFSSYELVNSEHWMSVYIYRHLVMVINSSSQSIIHVDMNLFIITVIYALIIPWKKSFLLKVQWCLLTLFSLMTIIIVFLFSMYQFTSISTSTIRRCTVDHDWDPFSRIPNIFLNIYSSSSHEYFFLGDNSIISSNSH